MSDRDHPKNPDATPGPDAGDNDDQELIIETLPILEGIHSRLARNLPQIIEGATIEAGTKSVFDGALYAYDRAQTQDWSGLKTQLEDIATQAILTLILLNRRRNPAV
jgi:hypothetical protein